MKKDETPTKDQQEQLLLTSAKFAHLYSHTIPKTSKQNSKPNSHSSSHKTNSWKR
jgi:hypothetical protein